MEEALAWVDSVYRGNRSRIRGLHLALERVKELLHSRTQLTTVGTKALRLQHQTRRKVHALIHMAVGRRAIRGRIIRDNDSGVMGFRFTRLQR